MSKNVIPFHGADPGDILRAPPHNYEAERGLLGALLMNNRAYDRVSEFLLAEHFADPTNALIFDVMSRMIAKGQQANPVTLKTYLEADDLIIGVGGIKYLANLAAGSMTVINAGDYGKLIYDLYLRRELICLGTDMVNAAFEAAPEETATDQIEESTARLTNLYALQTDQTAMMFEDAVKAAMQRWEQHDRGEIAGLSTGLADLDKELGLLEEGDLFVLAGASSMGKTALAITMAYNAAKQFKDDAVVGKTKPKRSVVFSGEMSYIELASRALTTYTGVQGPRRRQIALEEHQWAKLINFQEEIAGLPLILDDRSAPSLSYVRSRLRQEQRKGEIGLIVLDYLQIMSADPGRRPENRTEELSVLVRGCKSMARAFKCPLILLSSINRKVEDRENKRPNMGDIRGSGDIEFAADMIGFCYREEYYLERDEPSDSNVSAWEAWNAKMAAVKNVAEVIVAKGRNSGTGIAKLRFDRTRTLYSDIAMQQSLPFDQGNLI